MRATGPLSVCLFLRLSLTAMGWQSIWVGDRFISGVVRPARPAKDEEEARDELSRYLEMICGEKPRDVVWTTGLDGGKAFIFIGRAALANGGFSEHEMEEVGADGYIVKPFSPTKLIEKIGSFLSV